jgi:hypothetical protein
MLIANELLFISTYNPRHLVRFQFYLLQEVILGLIELWTTKKAGPSLTLPLPSSN